MKLQALKLNCGVEPRDLLQLARTREVSGVRHGGHRTTVASSGWTQQRIACRCSWETAAVGRQEAEIR